MLLYQEMSQSVCRDTSLISQQMTKQTQKDKFLYRIMVICMIVIIASRRAFVIANPNLKTKIVFVTFTILYMLGCVMTLVLLATSIYVIKKYQKSNP